MGFFNRKPPEPPPPKTRISAGTTVEGDLESKDEVTLEGRLSGTLDCQGVTVLAAKARFSGTLRSRTLRCEGRGEGKVEVPGPALFCAGSAWQGEFHAAGLSVEKGAILNGTFHPPKR